MRTHPYLVNYANESGQIEYTELGRPTIRVNLTKSELDDYFEAVKLKTNTQKYFACPTAPYVISMAASLSLTPSTELPMPRSLQNFPCLSKQQSTSHAPRFSSAIAS